MKSFWNLRSMQPYGKFHAICIKPTKKKLIQKFISILRSSAKKIVHCRFVLQKQRTNDAEEC